MARHVFLLLACVLACVSVDKAAGHTTVYVAELSGAAESPANDSLGLGSVIVTLDLDLFAMRVQVEFSGLTGSVTAAHIHGVTGEPGEGLADVITAVPTFPEFPTGVASGAYDRSFDLTSADSYNPAFLSLHDNSISLASNAFFAGLAAGTTYLNIHTSAFEGGEIRGFLLQAPKADFDHNGVVDGDDLTSWRDAFGVEHHGDANDDSRTDGADFLIWQQQLGLEAAPPNGHHHHAIGVPEPASAALATIGIALAAHRLRRTDVLRIRCRQRTSTGKSNH